MPAMPLTRPSLSKSGTFVVSMSNPVCRIRANRFFAVHERFAGTDHALLIFIEAHGGFARIEVKVGFPSRSSGF